MGGIGEDEDALFCAHKQSQKAAKSGCMLACKTDYDGL